MRLALNLGNLRGFGSRQVGQGVLHGWIGNGWDDSLTAWVPSSWDWPKGHLGSAHRLNSVEAGLAGKFVADNLSIRRHLRAGDSQALFSLGDTSLPHCSVPHLLLVQQAYLAYPPDQWGFEPSGAFRVKMALMAAYFRAGLSTISHFTVQTQSMKARLCERWDINTARVSVVPSAIEFEPTRSWKPQSVGQQPYVAYVASASPHKNFELLAPMMQALPAALSDVVCRLTVRADEVPRLVELARTLDVLDRFEFLGAVDDIEALIAGAQAFVMPSHLESFGLPYYEAMAVGCPLVVADRDFAREACGDAALYASGDSGEEFAEQVGTVVASSALQKALSEHGRARFKSLHVSWNDVATSYRQLLTGMIGA